MTIQNIVSINLPVSERMTIRKNRHVPQGVDPENPGDLPRLAVITGTHGDELEGQYVCWLLNRILNSMPDALTGVVDIYPALNPLGVDTITRGIPQQREGQPEGIRAFHALVRGLHHAHVGDKIPPQVKGSELNAVFPPLHVLENPGRDALRGFPLVVPGEHAVDVGAVHTPEAFGKVD